MTEAYYIISALVALAALVFTIGWRVASSLADADKSILEHVSLRLQAREQALETVRFTAEQRYVETVRKLAEITERLVVEKVERLKELQGHITRAEFDKRIDSLENGQRNAAEKLDEVLRRLVARKQV